MCVGSMYFHLTVLGNVNRQNLFKHLKYQKAEQKCLCSFRKIIYKKSFILKLFLKGVLKN